MHLLAKTALAALTLLAAVTSAPAQYYDRGPANVIVGFYQRYLKRTPHPGEVNIHLRGMQNHGASLRNVEVSFLSSPEYFGRHGYSPPRWVRGMHRNALGRYPGPGETRHWLIRYDQYGGDRGAVAREFLGSAGGGPYLRGLSNGR